MSFRTRRWPAALATLLFVSAACGAQPATPGPATTTPAATTPAPGTTTPAGSPTASPAPGESTPPPPSESPTGPPPSGSAPPSQEGGTLIFAEWQPASQLNPFFTSAFTSFESLAPALRGLLTINEEGAWTADLAAEVASADNGGLVVNPDAPADCVTGDTPSGGDCFTLNLNLKPGLKWSDGTDLTMNDVKATYEAALAWGLAGVGCSGCATTVPLVDATIEDPATKFAPENRYIKSLDVSDDGLTATVVWQKNYAGWLGWASFTPLQGAWLATVTPENASSAMPVGPGIEAVPWSGPFMIVSASSEGIDYDKNPNWTLDPAHLDHLRERFYASKDGMITDFLSGNVDLAFDMTQADFPAIQAVSADVGRAELDSAWQYEHFDLQNAHKNVGLDDVEVRTAIAMSVNKQDMVDVLFPGMGVAPACSVAPPGTPWRAEDVECAPYDPDGAMTKLDTAGWKAAAVEACATNADGSVVDCEGRRAKDLDGDGKIQGNEIIRLQLCTTAGNPTRLTELGKLNAYLNAIGIPSDISTADAGSVVFAGWADTTPDTKCSIYRGTYDIADFAYILGGDIYSNYYYGYHSSQIPSDQNPDGSNDTRLNNPDMDAALEALGVEVDPAKQNEHAATVQKVIATQNNEIPLYYRAETTGVSVNVGGWTKYNPSSAGPTWKVETWFCATAKCMGG